MTANASLAPSPFELESCFVKQPVSTAHLGRYAEEAAHVAGAKVNDIASAVFRERGIFALALLDPKTHPVAWRKSAGTKVVRVEAEFAGWTSYAECTCTVSLPTGATWLTHNGLDGSLNIVPPQGNSYIPYSVTGWVDVSGCALGTLLYWAVTTANVSGDNASLSHLSITEVPVDALDPVGGPDEPAIDPASTLAGNPMVDGDDTTPGGFARLAYVLDQARTHFRQHFQLVGIEADPAMAPVPLWSLDGGETNAPIYWARAGDGVTSDDPEFQFQVRGHLGPGVTQPTTFAVRYRDTDGVDCSIGVYLEGVGGAGGFWQTLTLPATVGTWAWASVTVYVPCDGTDGMVRVKFRATNPQDPGSYLYFADIALIDVGT